MAAFSFVVTTTQVFAAVIRNGERFLIGRRPVHKRHGGLWEFPGGKLESGEGFLPAAKRELAEELGVAVTAIGDVMFSIDDPGSEFTINFIPTTIAGEPSCIEHSAIRWVTAEELRSYELAPSDRAFTAFLNAETVRA